MNIYKFLNTKKIFSSFALIVLAFNQVLAQSTAVAGTAAEVSKTDGLAKMVGYYVLVLIIVCVFVGIVGKILSVYDLTKKIQGKKEGIKWDNINGVMFAIILVVGLYGAYWCFTVQGAQILPAAASEHGAKIDTMFNITLVITTIVFVITHILLFTFAYRYKYNKNKKAYYYPHNNTIEKYWTIAPAIVLTVMVLMGFFTWRGITNISKNDMANALQIDVTAHQFAWDVRYAGKDNVAGNKSYKLIGSLNGLNNLGLDLSDKRNYDDLKVAEIVLPVNKSVRFTMGSMDVIHSFYMPDFRVQMNCVPGMATFFQFTPTITTAEMRERTGNGKYNYQLYCAKICGASHYNMKFAVRVVSQKEYNQWIKVQKPIVTDGMKKEYKLAMKDNLAKENKIASNN